MTPAEKGPNGTKAARGQKESYVYASDAANDHTVGNIKQSDRLPPTDWSSELDEQVVQNQRATFQKENACVQFLRFNAIILQR